MNFDDLFEKRSIVSWKLKGCIRDNGYTKVAFAEKSNISRPTLDKLLNAKIDNKSTFDRHVRKSLQTLNMSADELMSYYSTPSMPVATVYSQNAPVDHEMSEKAKRQYNLLLDIVDLCTIYY